MGIMVPSSYSLGPLSFRESLAFLARRIPA